MHSLARADELGQTPADRFQRAMALSTAEDIDLASSYSVLLGLTQLEKVRRLSSDGAQPEPGFRAAVAEGRLKARQVKERGDRLAYATRLALRHRMPMETAFLVADNHLSLADALRAQPPRPTPAAVGGPRVVRPAVWAALALVALVAALWGRSGGPGPESALGAMARVTVGSAEVVTDSKGRVTQVLGPDPRSVLVAYCRTGRRQGRFEALDVAPSPLDPKGARVGLLRDPFNEKATLAITILADLVANRWVAGDGRTPLEPLPAPAGAEAALRRH